MDNKVKLEIVKVKGSSRWAQKATMGKEVRYRGFIYRKDALANLAEWIYIKENYLSFERDFYHNFHTAEELHIQEVAHA